METFDRECGERNRRKRRGRTSRWKPWPTSPEETGTLRGDQQKYISR